MHHLMQTLQMYADMGIKMFKFDFAYFDAATPDAKCTMLPTDIEEDVYKRQEQCHHITGRR